MASKGVLEPLLRAEKIPKATPDVLQESKCIAAIDFGTSSLSVAYTTPLTPTTREDVKVIPLHKTCERVPNAILIVKDQETQDCKTVEIGHQAQSIYSKKKKDAEKFIYFERIKNLLKRDKVSSW